MPSATRSKPAKKWPASPGERARATRSLLFSVPGEYFQLVPAGEALMCVAQVSREQALREPQATLTREQLGGLLYESGIPVVKGAALAGYLSSLHPVPAFERHVPERFARDPGQSRLSQSAWRGSVGEVSAQYQGWLPQQDLNAVRYNHPIYDLRDPGGGLNSVKTSVRAGGAGGEPFTTYLTGLGDVLGNRAATLERARQGLYSHLPKPEGEVLLIRNGYISVNEDHVEPLKAALRDPASYRREEYRGLADQLMKKLGPARVDGKVYRDYAALERVLREAGSNSALRSQLEAALRAVREGLASRVRSNGITTQHLVRLLQFRLELARANPQMRPEQFKSWTFPEMLLAARHGRGLVGNLGAATVAGGRGAVVGAGVSVVLELGHIYFEPQRDKWRILHAGVAGGVSGWVGGSTQAVVTGSAGQALSRGLVTQGFNSRLASGAGRGLGGFAAGGVAAPVFAATSLALDDQEHTGTDYAATGARAFVAGTLSSAVAAGVVGAIWGSEVPIAGNIVGFIVGFTGYYIIDSLTGEQVEQGVRQGLQGDEGSGR